MGRHSIPDPDDPADEPDHGSRGYRPDDSAPTEYIERIGHFEQPGHIQPPGSIERPDYLRPEYPEPVYHDYPEPAYDDGQYGETGYREEDYADGQYSDQEYSDEEYGDEEYPDEEYADEPFMAMTRRPGSPPGKQPRSNRPAHGGDWEGGEWTGSHRAITTGRRPVSVGVIAALVTVVVVIGAFILWRFFGDALSNRSNTAAARCVNGDLNVAVVADPSISDQIQTLANNYNKTGSHVGDRCVKVGVRSAESDQVVNGFIGKWPAELGDQPALWIPASSVSQARLEAAAGAKTVGDSRSLVTSPVMLAIRPALKDALAQQNWGTLPSLQTNPTALDGLNLPGWGSLRLALPLVGDGDAAYLAAEAVAAASAPAGAPASAGAGAVNTLVGGQPRLADNKASTAFDALLTGDPAIGPVHAVVTTEQQLFHRAASIPDAKNAVASWLPPGPTALADYPTVLLSGNGVSSDQASAASEFARFMRRPEQLAELAKAGFRTEGAKPPKSDVTSFDPVSAPLSIGDNAMRATLASTLTAPSDNPAVTVMLDQSMPTQEGGKSRLANVVAALKARLQALPATSTVGLWTFDGKEGRSEVSTGPLSDPVKGQPRSSALSAALDSQSASGGGAVSFTTLRMLYTDAMTNYRQGHNNSILVITAGPHTDQSLDGAGLQQYIRGAFDAARPVAVNVIDFGADSDRATWEAVAQASGGGYQNLTTSAGPELTSAIATFLG